MCWVFEYLYVKQPDVSALRHFATFHMDNIRMQSTNSELVYTSGKKTYSDFCYKLAILKTQRSDIFRCKSQIALDTRQWVL